MFSAALSAPSIIGCSNNRVAGTEAWEILLGGEQDDDALDKVS